jgi:hypothetical protein
MVSPTNQDIRNTNSQTAAPIQLRLNRDRRHTVIADSSGTDEAIRARLEVRSSRKDSSQETPTPSSFNSSHDFVARGRSASNNDGGDDDREDFVFPDPLSPVTEREVSSDAELMESSSSENTIVEAKLAAELCGSPQQKRSHKGKGIARDPTPATNSQEPIFLPLLKEDSHSQRHTDHKEQPHKSRSTSFHSKLAKLNKSLASGSSAHETPKQPARSREAAREAERDAKILRHLRLQTLIQSDQIKHLKVVTKDLAEALNRLQGSIARDIQMLQENSEGMRENHNQLIGACEGMRRELLELKVRMAQEKFGQRVVSRDGDEHGDGDRRGAVPDLPFPPPHSLLQPTSMEYAFSTRPCYISPFDPCNSNPPPSTTVTGTNNLPSMPGAVITGQSLSQPPSASHAVNPDSAYNSVPLQYFDHYRESHILQNPQGCRWHYCSVCRGGGERVVPGFE